jgi:hypothetical protein
MTPKVSETTPATSPVPVFQYVATVLLSWLLPGAGHWCLGSRVRAVALGACVLSLFWVGQVVFGENMAVSRAVHPVFFVGQAGVGASAFAANRVWGKPSYSMDRLHDMDRELPQDLNLGILCTLVAGLLNVLLVLHAMDPRSWQQAREAEEHEPRKEAT